MTVSPATVFIPGGATTPGGQPQLTSVNVGTVAITASAPGYATAVQNVQATATVTFSPTSITFTSLGTQRVILALSASAPPGVTQAGRCDSPDSGVCGITVSLSSDNQNVATVQPSVSYFPDGSSQAINQIPITAIGQGTTIIHAGAPPYIPDTTLIVTVGGALQPPTANGGTNQTGVAIGATVQLSGTGTDPQSLSVTYQWSLSKPAGSTAVLSNASVANPTFVADKFGTYTAQLIVSDGTLSSAPSTVTITTQRPKPIANAGSGQTVVVGSTVNLSGSGSSSIDNSPLSYAFTLGRPAGSTASLSGANTISPSFVPDVPGSYTIQLIVNDGSLNSDPATITITATAPAGGPASITANSGTPQNTNLNQAPCAPLTALVKDSSGNPLSGITVTFTAPSSGPSGTFAGSVTTATAVTNGTGIATAPVFTGNGTAGSYAVTASVTGVSTPASFALTNVAGSPPSIMVTSGASQSATAGTSFAAPLAATVTGTQCGNSVIVTFAAPGSGASGTFAGGGTTATVPTNGSGVATSPVFTANSIPGGYSVTASAPGSNQASFPLTNTPMAGSGGITVSSASVGQNLQTAVTLTLAQPAGPGGVQVNVASGDPSRLLVAGRAVDVGQGSLPKPAAIDPGATTTIIFVQGLGSGGTVSITASGSDGSSGTGIISLNPSGFVLFGPSGAGVSSFST
ncbi:MAG: PKD domain-containing protein, partial [Acidobacteriota bacterium]|nr:PKD domain-containing protein [Acidobacteriota bacterium]